MLRIFANWQHSHEPADADVGVFCQFFVGIRRIADRKPALGKLVAHIDFDQAIGSPIGFFRALLQFLREFETVERMQKITFPDQVFDLVCLQMPDKMAVRAADKVELIPKFLHFVLADVRNACGDRFVDLFGRARFGRGNKRYFLPVRVSVCNFSERFLYVICYHTAASVEYFSDIIIPHKRDACQPHKISVCFRVQKNVMMVASDTKI